MMRTPRQLPIICEGCGSLALGELDGVPLCESCLVLAVGSCETSAIEGKVSPLRFVPPRFGVVPPGRLRDSEAA